MKPYEVDQQTLDTIVELGFNIKPEDVVSIRQHNTSFYRELGHKELLLGIMVAIEKVLDGTSGIHICIMKNGDVYARNYPYYDGYLDGLLLIRNQRKIWELVEALGIDQ